MVFKWSDAIRQKLFRIFLPKIVLAPFMSENFSAVKLNNMLKIQLIKI